MSDASYKDIVNALNEEFSTSVNRIYVHSLDREVSFKEVRVSEQKALTKILIENEDKEDVIYQSIMALIQMLCLEKDTVDFSKLTELDRIKIMLELYQGNFFNEELTFTCSKCGTENTFKIDFDHIVTELNKMKFDDVEVILEDDSRTFIFMLNFPKTSRMLEFMTEIANSKRAINKKDSEKITNIDMFDMFIKSFIIEGKAEDGKIINVNCEETAVTETEKILEVLPQTILYGKDGILEAISSKIFSKVEQLFVDPVCLECGTQQKGVVSLADFFI